MAERIFEVAFRIAGQLSGNFMSAVTNAARSLQTLKAVSNSAYGQGLGKLQQTLARLNETAAMATKFNQLKQTVKDNSAAYNQAQAKTAELKIRYEQAQKTTNQLKAKHNELKKAFDQSKAAAENLKTKLQGLKSIQAQMKAAAQTQAELKQSEAYKALQIQIQQTTAALKQTKAEMNAAKADMKTLGNSIRSASNELKTIGNSFENAKSKMQSLKATLASQRAELAQISSSLSRAGFSAGQFGASETALRAKIEQTTQAIKRQAQEQQRLGQAQARRSQASFDFNNASGNFNNALTTAQQVMSPLTGSIGKAMELQRTMSEVKALTQMDNIRTGNIAKINAEMASLMAQVKKLGAETNYKQNEVAQAQVFIARTGWNTNQILASTPHFLNLAAARHMDMARAADIATNIMTAFGKKAEESQHVTDVLAYTFTHSNQDLEQLGQTMKYAAPVAKMFGSSLEETAAMTKFMADAGVQGSQAGTSLRQTMLRLVAPPKKASKAMEEAAITVDDATAAWQNANEIARENNIVMREGLTPGRQMLSIMEQIDKNMAGKTSQEKMSIFSAITGINAVSGALNLFEAGSEAVKEFTDALEKCDRVAEQTRIVMTDNAAGALEILNSAIEAVQTNIGYAFLDTIQNSANAVTPLVTNIANWIEENQQLVFVVGTTAAAVTGLVVVFALFGAIAAGVSYGIATITAAMTALSGVTLTTMAGVVAAMLPVIAIIALLAGAAYLIYANWSSVEPYFENLWGIISSGAQQAWEVMQPAIEQIGTAFSTLFNAISNGSGLFTALIVTLASIGIVITEVFSTALQVVAAIISAIIGVIGGLITFITGAFAGDWQTAWEGLKQIVIGIFGGLKDVVKALFGGIFDTLKNISNTTKNILSGNFSVEPKVQTPEVSSVTAAATSEVPVSQAAIENATAQQQAAEGAKQNAEAQTQAANTLQQVQTATAPISETIQQVSANAPVISEVMQQIPQTIQPTGEAMQQLNMNVAMVNPALSQQGMTLLSNNTELANNNSQLTTVNAALQVAGTALGSFNAALGATNGSLQSLSANSSSAAASIQSLGSAAQMAVSTMQSAATSVANAAATAAVKPTANYLGGIYPKGEFLTTFAERSAEAAIPIDGSKRAIELWQQTGIMLGVYDGVAGGFETTPSRQEQGETLNEIRTSNNTTTIRGQQTKQREQIEKQRRERIETQKIIIQLAEPIQRVADNAQTAMNIKTSTLNAAQMVSEIQSRFSETNSLMEVFSEIGNVSNDNTQKQISTKEITNISKIPLLPKIRQVLLETILEMSTIPIVAVKSAEQLSNSMQNISTLSNVNTQNESIKTANNTFSSESLESLRNYQELVKVENPKMPIIEMPGQLIEAPQGEGILGEIYNEYKANQSEILNNQSFMGSQSVVSPNINVSVTIEGNADAETMKEAAQQAFGQAAMDFRREMENYKHEQERRRY